jgi:acyl-CoA thioester hydrolase
MPPDDLAAFRQRHPVTRDIPVAWGEMDALGHVNNVVYFRYFETARIALFERVGFAVSAASGGIGPILAATDCRFRVPVTYPDTVTAAAWIESLGEDEFIMGYAVFSHARNRVAAEGAGRIVAYDYTNHRKTRLDEDLRGKLAGLERGA